MEPHAEFVHWFFAAGVLLLGLILVAQAIVGEEVWRMRRWRIYLWPGIAFGLGVLMWPVMTFFTNSAIHMVAHGIWAQALMVMGAAELGLAKGKLHSRWWRLAAPVGIALSGAAFLVHEQNSWYFARAAFLHHLLGWTLVGAALFPLGLVFRPALDVPAVRVRGVRDRGLGDALLRPRHRSDLRAPLAARGGAAPMRRLLVLFAACALVVPAAAWAHATLRDRVARVPAGAPGRAELDPAQLRPVRAVPLHRGLRREGEDVRRSGGRARIERGGACSAAAAGRLHGSLARALCRRSRRLRRLDVRGRREGPAADRGLRCERARRAPRTSCGGCTSSSFAVLIGSLGFRLVCLRGWQVPPRVEKRLYLLAGAGSSARSRSGSSRSACAARTCSSCRSGSTSTAT